MNSTRRPRKRFGQHFLTCQETIARIVAAIAPAPDDRLVEIGPGRGAITVPLAERVAALHAIELDRDLAQELRRRFSDRRNVTIHEADALSFDFTTLGDGLRMVGNLPYNISTPVLFHLIGARGAIADMHFMLQREVVTRIIATPGGKDIGRLTIMLGCYMETVHLFDVPPTAFEPPPKVTSSVVRLRPLPPERVQIRDHSVLSAIVSQAFSRRRKTLRNALRGLVEIEDLEAISMDPACRPEQVPVSAWVALANRIAAQ